MSKELAIYILLFTFCNVIQSQNLKDVSNIRFLPTFEWKEEPYHIEIKDDYISKIDTNYTNHNGNRIRETKTKDIRIIDINGDSFGDIIYQGSHRYDNVEGIYTEIIINQHGDFVNVFSEMGSIIDFKFNDSKITHIYMKDNGCCGSLSIDFKAYEVTYLEGIFNYEKITESTCFWLCNNPLPDSVLEKPFKFETSKDSIYLRNGPEVYRKECYPLEKSNVIAEINKKEIGFALADSIDSNGTIWYFSAIPSTTNFKNFQFNIRSFKANEAWILGWISNENIKKD